MLSGLLIKRDGCLPSFLACFNVSFSDPPRYVCTHAGSHTHTNIDTQNVSSLFTSSLLLSMQLFSFFLFWWGGKNKKNTLRTLHHNCGCDFHEGVLLCVSLQWKGQLKWLNTGILSQAVTRCLCVCFCVSVCMFTRMSAFVSSQTCILPPSSPLLPHHCSV